MIISETITQYSIICDKCKEAKFCASNLDEDVHSKPQAVRWAGMHQLKNGVILCKDCYAEHKINAKLDRLAKLPRRLTPQEDASICLNCPRKDCPGECDRYRAEARRLSQSPAPWPRNKLRQNADKKVYASENNTDVYPTIRAQLRRMDN